MIKERPEDGWIAALCGGDGKGQKKTCQQLTTFYSFVSSTDLWPPLTTFGSSVLLAMWSKLEGSV